MTFHIVWAWTYYFEKSTDYDWNNPKNKPIIHPQLLAKGTQKYTSAFEFIKYTTLVSYIMKAGKCLVIQGTLHHDRKIAEIDTKKLQLILDYNSTKKGVDTLNKLSSHSSSWRKPSRWIIAVFSNSIDMYE